MMGANHKVKDYMSTRVITVSPDMTLEEVKRLMRETEHDGFPVVENGEIKGIITTRDMVLREGGKFVRDVMTTEVTVTFPETRLIDAARVMFRRGFSRLPVVEKEGDKRKLIGIVTITDVIRSHIERATPEKVRKLRDSLEKLYGIKSVVRMGYVKISELRPTQGKVHPDEYRGREYELKRGLAEPVVVIKSGNRLILVDGHHRALAARKLGIEEIKAYIIVLERDVELGMERTARKQGLRSIDDIKIAEETEHGIVADIVGGGE